MALSLHQALGLHWARPVVLRYQTANPSIRPRDDTAVFRTASCTRGRTVSVDAGTTMDDAVPRHRWRQAFGCEGEE